MKDLGLGRGRGLNSLVLGGRMGEEVKDGQKAAALKEDIELDREETEDNRLNKVRVSSFSFLFDLPMLGILLTHPYPRHHLPPVDLLIWEYTSSGDYSSTIHHPAVLSGGPPSFMARPRCSETAERAAR